MPETTVDLPHHELTHLQVLDEDGTADKELDPDLPDEALRRLARTMLLSRRYDERRLKLQRQGRLGTFAPAIGQEAAQLGAVHALDERDWFVPAFREVTAELYRGMEPADDLLYVAGFEEGIALDEESHQTPIAIPVATQIPHAMGLAWSRSLQGTDEVVLTTFGDGATSEGDFHEGANLAALRKVPLVMLCQNNQYAISVPREEQTASKTLAQKAFAYAIPALQVDGNDLLGVYVATHRAIDRAREGEGPTMIEALTYRLSVHTTADDPSKYRDEAEEEAWRAKDPLKRLRTYLTDRGVLDDATIEEWEEEIKETVDAAVETYEQVIEEADDARLFEHNLASNGSYLARQREAFPGDIPATGRRGEDE